MCLAGDGTAMHAQRNGAPTTLICLRVREWCPTAEQAKAKARVTGSHQLQPADHIPRFEQLSQTNIHHLLQHLVRQRQYSTKSASKQQHKPRQWQPFSSPSAVSSKVGSHPACHTLTATQLTLYRSLRPPRQRHSSLVRRPLPCTQYALGILSFLFEERARLTTPKRSRLGQCATS